MRLWITILAVCLATGCETMGPGESEFERISREIERTRAEAERAATQGNNIRVSVNLLRVSETDRLAIDSLLRYVDKGVVVAKRPELLERSGLEVGVAGENFEARLRVVKQNLKESEESEIFLVLADGATGYISIGQEIAVPRFYYAGRWYSGVEYDFRRAGRSLQATARRRPSGLIEMQLTPVFSNFLNDGGDLVLTELSTTVTARPGQTVVIGGGDTSRESVATALLGYDRTDRRERTLITVTPYVQ